MAILQSVEMQGFGQYRAQDDPLSVARVKVLFPRPIPGQVTMRVGNLYTSIVLPIFALPIVCLPACPLPTTTKSLCPLSACLPIAYNH